MVVQSHRSKDALCACRTVAARSSSLLKPDSRDDADDSATTTSTAFVCLTAVRLVLLLPLLLTGSRRHVTRGDGSTALVGTPRRRPTRMRCRRRTRSGRVLQVTRPAWTRPGGHDDPLLRPRLFRRWTPTLLRVSL